MKTLNNLNDLLIEQVRNLYDAETQWKNSIEKTLSRTKTPEVKKLMEDAKIKCTENSKKLEKVLTHFKKETFVKPNLVAREIANQANFIIDNTEDPKLMDAGLIATHQQMNHYKIAGYGTTASFAKTLKEKEVAEWMHESAETEKDLDEKLTKLAKDKINTAAFTNLESIS